MSAQKEVNLSFRCDEEFARAVNMAAAERDMSRSDFIRIACELFMCFPTDKEIIHQRGEFFRKTSVILERI